MGDININLTDNERLNLNKRYLIWLYKMTREALDRIDRKFTQLGIDEKMLNSLKQIRAPKDKEKWQSLIDEFSNYIDKKSKNAQASKFLVFPDELQPSYLFLKQKLRIIEKLIEEEFGSSQLERIIGLYENEMEKRIIQEREHR